jgi:hypothetical protein
MHDRSAVFEERLVRAPCPHFAILRRHWRAFLIMNALFFGVHVFAMAVVALEPSMQTDLVARVRREVRSGWMAPVADAYLSGNLPLAILWTFSLNFFIGALLTINLPSLVIPFSGIAAGLWRAALWGVMLSPVDPATRLRLLPHHLNTLLEGECYVLAMLAAYLQGRWALPGTCLRGEAYGDGLLESARLYRLIVPLLVIAAIYEAIEVIYLQPLLK